jgi:hypothetical protein
MAGGTTTDSSGASKDEAVRRDQDTPSGEPDTGHDSEKSEAEMLRLFVGPNADKFLKIYRAQRDGKRAFSFNWVVLLAALPWFFYRKLYVIGVGLLLVPIIVVVIFPKLSGVGTTGFAAALAVLANMLYVQIALRRIKKLKALNLSPAERDERIRKAGGTSPAGAVFGTLILASMIALLFVDLASAQLPECASGDVRDLARSALTDSLSKNGVDAEGLSLSDFNAVESAEDGSRHLSSFSAELAVENTPLYLSVTWEDRSSGEFQIHLGTTQDAVSR